MYIPHMYKKWVYTQEFKNGVKNELDIKHDNDTLRVLVKQQENNIWFIMGFYCYRHCRETSSMTNTK